MLSLNAGIASADAGAMSVVGGTDSSSSGEYPVARQNASFAYSMWLSRLMMMMSSPACSHAVASSRTRWFACSAA